MGLREARALEAADRFVFTNVEVANRTVDADVTAADDVGTALGWTFALSALIISAA